MLNIRSRLDVGMVEVRVGKILVSLSLRCVFGVGKIAAAFSQIILLHDIFFCLYFLLQNFVPYLINAF